MFDISNIDMWKYKMSAYLIALRFHVYLPTTKESYLDNDKYLKANTQATDALQQTLSKKYLYLISHCDCDFAFVVWNTLTSPKEQTINILEKESSRDESDQASFMVQENDSLEVNLDSHLEDYDSSSFDDNAMDTHALNEELFMFYENLL